MEAEEGKIEPLQEADVQNGEIGGGSPLENQGEAVEMPADADNQLPKEAVVEQSAENPIENPVEIPIENPVEIPFENPVENPTEAPFNDPNDEDIQNSNENPPQASIEKKINSHKNSLNANLHSQNLPNVPQVQISLRATANLSQAKSYSSLNIAESLKIREAAKETKISNKRLKEKASQIDPMRSVPLINPTSKKILSDKRKKELKKQQQTPNDDSIYDYFPESTSENKNSESLKERIELKKAKSKKEFITLDIVKNSMKLREEFEKSIKEEEEKKKVEAKKRMKELNTQNKPLKTEQSKNNSYEWKSNSLNLSQLKNTTEGSQSTVSFSYRIPPPTSKLTVQESDSRIGETPIITQKYSQISPFVRPVKHQTGFNSQEILSKGQQMVDYKLLVGN